MKLLLIDGNNLCFRMFHSPQNVLKYRGRSIGVMFGFLKSLISLHKVYPDYFRVIAWEGGYARRLQASEQAVKDGIIPDAYKANRDREVTPEMEDFRSQRDHLKESLTHIRCMQVAVQGYEADDVIYSYCQEAKKWGGMAAIISSDRDFYQCLSPEVHVYAMKQEKWTEERFVLEFGMEPWQWVEVGALQGDTGDNIHGVDGWGPVTAVNYIREYGTMEDVITAVQAKAKKSKKEEVLLQQIAKARLAKSLKKMDIIAQLPKPRTTKNYTAAELEAFFLDVGFASMLKEIPRLI